MPHLERLGWDFSFWTPSPGPLRDEIEERGHPASGEPRLLRYAWRPLKSPPGVMARARSVPGYLRRFRHWVERQRPDVVHANTSLLLPEAVVAHRGGYPVLIHVHEVLERSGRGRVAAWILRAASDEVVVPSQAAARALEDAGVPHPRVIRNGVPLPEGTSRSRASDERTTIVGTVATVSPRKGSGLFLAASRLVRQARPEVEFRMVGPLAQEPDRAWAQALTAAARDEGVRWSTTADVFGELARWDVFVLPSRQDPFPLVVLEAMAAELPVVATRVGGIPEQVVSGTGILVPPDDVKALSDAILDLVRRPEERARLGAAGLEHVARELSLERQATSMDEAYRASIARAAPQ